MQVEAQTDGVISVPLFGYDGYCAQADGRRSWKRGLTKQAADGCRSGPATKGEVKL